MRGSCVVFEILCRRFRLCQQGCALQGVCKHASGLIIFTDALPGEELTATVSKVKKGLLHLATSHTILCPIHDRVPLASQMQHCEEQQCAGPVLQLSRHVHV